MKFFVFVGTSVDGFIARRDGAYDFLGGDEAETHGYEEFMAGIDTLLIGRNTFEVVAKMESWPYEGKRVVVLSRRSLDFSRIQAPVEQMSGDPAEIAKRLEASGAKHVYVDGGETVQEFLRAGLVHKLTITRVPVLIGEGIPLFGKVEKDVRLRHINTRQYRSGLVTSEYEVIAEG
jgi:dihydrofolate reductase